MSNYSLKLKSNGKKKDKDYTLNLGGDLSLNSISEIHEELKKELDKVNSLQIVLNEVEQIDITLIQVLYAIEKEFKTENKSVQITMNLSDQDELLLKRTGFNKYFEKQ